jgi:hypothetical protein
MSYEVLVAATAAGLLGGAVSGILSYWDKITGPAPSEGFDLKKFAFSMVVPVVIGFASGFFTTDVSEAFSAGLVGKKLWEVVKAKTA